MNEETLTLFEPYWEKAGDFTYEETSTLSAEESSTPTFTIQALSYAVAKLQIATA